MRSGPCRSCSKLVEWATSSKSGKPTPVERNAEKGNVLIDGTGRAFFFANADDARRQQDTFPDSELAMSDLYLVHHAVCPAGPSWQGKKRGDADAPKAAPQEAFPF